MLDPWIIEEIQRREEEDRRRESQVPATIELPDVSINPDEAEQDRPAGEPRGIAQVDFRV